MKKEKKYIIFLFFILIIILEIIYTLGILKPYKVLYINNNNRKIVNEYLEKDTKNIKKIAMQTGFWKNDTLYLIPKNGKTIHIEAENNKNFQLLSTYIKKKGYNYDLVTLICLFITLYILGNLIIKIKNSYL